MTEHEGSENFAGLTFCLSPNEEQWHLITMVAATLNVSPEEFILGSAMHGAIKASQVIDLKIAAITGELPKREDPSRRTHHA